MLWHIIKMYSAHGVKDFIICCGYLGYVIKEYFVNYALHMSDVTFDLENNSVTVLRERTEPWRVTLIDTGENTLTGGRLKRAAPHVEDESEFCMTYGDGLSDVDISSTINFHRNHGRWATVTAVKPPGRFGALELSGEMVTGFAEKPAGDCGLISGGFRPLPSLPQPDGRRRHQARRETTKQTGDRKPVEGLRAFVAG